MTRMRQLLCLLLLASFAAVSMAADEPSETDLAGITYFAPVCPFYYRMMGPDGELREFQQLADGRRRPWTARWSCVPLDTVASRTPTDGL